MEIPSFVEQAGLPNTGEYSALIEVDLSRLITREWTTHDHALIAITLSLRPEGAAGAQVWCGREHRESMSRFAPRGPSSSRQQGRDQATFEGTWSMSERGVRLELDSSAGPERLTLLCHAGTTEAGPALGCEVLAAPAWLLPPGRAEASGSGGWLLLGPTPGLVVSTQQGFHDQVPGVLLRNADHRASEADLDASWRYR